MNFLTNCIEDYVLFSVILIMGALLTATEHGGLSIFTFVIGSIGIAVTTHTFIQGDQ